jgi:hypothetical protein
MWFGTALRSSSEGRTTRSIFRCGEAARAGVLEKNGKENDAPLLFGRAISAICESNAYDFLILGSYFLVGTRSA